MPPQLTETNAATHTTSTPKSPSAMAADEDATAALSALQGLKSSPMKTTSAGAAAAAATAAAATANYQHNFMSHLVDAAAMANPAYDAATAMLHSTNQVSKGPHKKRAASLMSETSSKHSDTKDSMTEEEKKAERRAANRRSAFQSRQRRKILIEDLQRTVAALSKENTDLRKVTEDMQRQLELTLVENQQLRMAAAKEAGAQKVKGADDTKTTATAGTTSPGKASAASPVGLSQLLQRQDSGAQAAAAAAAAAAETERLINAKLALLAAQNRVSELERAQQPAATSPWAAALGGGFMGDAGHLARIQELMRLSSPAASMSAATNTTAELANLRRLMDLREHQQQQAVAHLAAATPKESVAAPTPTAATITAPPAGIPATATPAPTPRDKAPGLQLLLESLHANGTGAAAASAPAAPASVVSTSTSATGSEMDKIMAAAAVTATSPPVKAE